MGMHKQFGEIRDWIGAEVNVWAWGAPGAGKTHMAEQIADDLQLGFYPVYLGPTSTESKLLGFLNASIGAYVKGLAVDPYEKGGLLYLDEPDNADASVLVATNALLSNSTYRFPNGELKARHPNFRVLAGANTIGTGSTQGFKRNAQDAALRSRFVKVKFEYDEALELELSGGNKLWTEWVQKVRRCISKQAKCNIWITSREIIYGAKGLARGIEPSKVVAATVFAEMPTDVQQTVLSECGPFPPPAPKSTAAIPGRWQETAEGGYVSITEKIHQSFKKAESSLVDTGNIQEQPKPYEPKPYEPELNPTPKWQKSYQKKQILDPNKLG